MDEEKTITTDEVVEETNEVVEQTGKKELSAETLLVQKNKATDKLAEANKTIAELQAKIPVVKEEKVSENNERLAAVEFKIANPSLDAEVIDKVFKLAKAEGKTPNDMLEDPMVKTYIEKKSQDANNAAATPQAGRSSLGTPEKPVSDFTDAERKEAFIKAMTG